MSQWLWWLLLPFSIVASHITQPLPAAAMSSIASSPAPVLPAHCLRNCGAVEIPYPFGIGEDCYWPGMDAGFNVTCNNSFNPPRIYVFGNIEIINISVEASEMQIFSLPAYICYDSENTTEPNSITDSWLNTTGTPFMISPTRNLFTAIGCYAQSFLTGREDMSYLTGCITTCVSTEEAASDGEPCTGLGCCQTAIHANLSYVVVSWGNSTNLAWRYSPCNYGFVAERNWYNFSRRDLDGQGDDRFDKRFGERGIPMVLEWAIRNNGSCMLGTSGKPTAPACVSPHSYCENALQGDGYICKCLEGFKGNPYDTSGGGCANIDECELRKTNPSVYEELYPCGRATVCRDIDGNYKCKCKFFHTGDGKSKNGCRPMIPRYAFAIVVTFICVVLALFAWREFKKRHKSRNFDENGGVLLKGVGITMFKVWQLKEITNKYNNIIGKGAYGEVYKGTNDKGEQVAVKRPMAKREGIGKDEFVKEISFQFRISHPNIVRLVGCCLETEVPILVFEFVPKGSLYDVLHGGDGQRHPLSLVERLDIAIGSAEALSYMHSHAEQHVHGDIKSANILLNNELSPKVSDFGSSKILAMGMYSRSVAADMSYVDPVYMKTGRFTDKSDVYSFGVVLLELITRKTAKYDGNRSLPMDFIASYKDDEGSIRRAMYDKDILAAGSAQTQLHLQCLEMIGELAFRCLKDYIEERPPMAEVLEELKKVKRRLDEAGN